MVTQGNGIGKGNSGKSRKDSWKKALLQTVRKPRNGFALLGLMVLLAVALLWNTVVVSYRPDQRGVYWSRFFGGTYNMILDEGTSYKLPWDDIYIYDMRLLTLEKTTNFVSKDGMKMGVQWSVRFRPNSVKLPDLHRRIGPEYANTVVLPEIAASMRQILGNYRAEEILAYDKNSLLEQITANTRTHFSENLIVVQNILIHKLLLPKGVSLEVGKKAPS